MKVFKGLTALMTALLLCLWLSSCAAMGAEDDADGRTFLAVIVEIKRDNVTVRADGDGAEDLLSFSTEDLDRIYYRTGSYVRLTCAEPLTGSGDREIDVVSWEAVTDLRDRAFTGTWLDEEKAQSRGRDSTDDLVILEIYADCFIAENVYPMPYLYKINGALDETWCVGDQVSCTYGQIRMDGARYVEGDLIAIGVSTLRLDPGAVYKPVICLYPTEETQVRVELATDGALTCTYPAYDGGWTVTAFPDGTLRDAKGQTYSYLYWEGETGARWDMSSGFCVRGGDTAAFLETALERLGLNRREANEFIVYWLPQMERNPYNIITFQTDAYTEAARLSVTPEPDTLIRVFMVWQASDSPVKLPEQELGAPEREGFTVVEWGGSEAGQAAAR